MLGVVTGKAIYKLEKALHFGGTTMPGRVVLKFFPKTMKSLKYPENVIMVTGSCGKGSTTKLITEVLERAGMKVCCNRDGANQWEGVATTIMNQTKGDTVQADALVLEVDERYLKLVIRFLRPKYLVINNITRDQPPRQGDYDIVYGEIMKGIAPDTHLIVNGDDPILRKFSLSHRGPITYFGIEKTKNSYEWMDDIKDYLYCPKCGHRMDFDYFHYGSVGSYSCPECGFKRENISYSVTDVDYENDQITVNGEDRIKVSSHVLFNLYNTIGAYAVCDILGIDRKTTVAALSDDKIMGKIYDEFTVNGRKYTILNCKAENNSTYNLALLYAEADNGSAGPKTIVLGHREISRRYVHFDLSWLYDINFEMLSPEDYVVCTGPNALDFAVRAKLAGIKEENIIVRDDMTGIRQVVEEKTKGNVYGVLNFDYVEPFRKGIKEETK